MDYIEIDDPDAVDKMMVLIDKAKGIEAEDIHPWVGMIVCSITNCLCTARVEDVGEMAILNFGWESRQDRMWPCTRAHLNEYYRVL